MQCIQWIHNCIFMILLRLRTIEYDGGCWILRNKLHAIEPTVNITISYRLPRRDEIIIHRLRIGHTYLLKRDSPLQCSACQTQLTVEHVLLLCPTWNAIRTNHFTVTSLLDLFSNVTSRCIVDFIKEVGFYRRIWFFTSIVFIFFITFFFVQCV